MGVQIIECNLKIAFNFKNCVDVVCGYVIICKEYGGS